MADRDRRPQQVQQSVRRILGHATAIGETLAGLRLGDDLEYGRRGERTGRTSSVSKPTEAANVAWEAAALRDSAHLVTLLIGSKRHTVGGALPLLADFGVDVPLAHPDDCPGLLVLPMGMPAPTATCGCGADDGDHLHVTDPQLVAWIMDARGGMPPGRAWTTAVRGLANLLVVTANDIHDAWQTIYTGRWVLDTRGMTALDEQTDGAARMAVARITELERDVRRLRDRVAPIPLRLCACPDVCRRVAGPGGYAEDCTWSGCADGCGRAVRRGTGATHPACRQQKKRDRDRAAS